MKSLFKRKAPKLSKLIVDYINGQLPSSFRASEALTKDDDTVIMIHYGGKGIQFYLNFDEQVSGLNDADKKHLNDTVILPALQELDKHLYTAHKQIEDRIKQLKGN